MRKGTKMSSRVRPDDRGGGGGGGGRPKGSLR